MKAVDFKETADEQFEFRYIKKYRSEKDKNHKKGTNVASSGVIPYAIVEANGNTFNPGEFFSFYLSLLPKNSTLEGKEGGWLFPRPRANTKVFNGHKEGEIMFEPNQKVGANTLAAMLPLLCSAVNSERYTNHQIRVTAIVFMRRAGLDWLTIAKITGHQSIKNLIKHYDLKVEVRDTTSFI